MLAVKIVYPKFGDEDSEQTIISLTRILSLSIVITG